MNINQRNRILSIVLLIVIIGLGYFLYVSITGPWQEVQEERRVTEQVRSHMSAINNTIRFYNERHGNFPTNMDSLIVFLSTDSLFQAESENILQNRNVDLDNFLISPRTGNMFTYALNDTVRPPLYIIEDPDTDDHIGTLTRVTDRGAPSWR